MRMKTKRAIRFALASLLAFGTASCWMPSFDPALSMSTEMDAFLAEHGVAEWRTSFSFNVKDDRWRTDTEFLPLRSAWPTGGFLVRRTSFGIGIAQLTSTVEGVEIPWSWDRDFNPLGPRTIVEPLAAFPSELLIMRDPFTGIEVLPAYSSEPCVCGPSLVYEGNALVAFGTETLSTGAENEILFRALVRQGYDGSMNAYSGQVGDDPSTAEAEVVFMPALEYGLATLPSAPFPPGWIAYDPSLGSTPWAISIDSGDPGLWRFGPPVPPDPPAPAQRKADLEALGTGTIHDGANPRILAEGPFFTDLYSLAGDHLGWLPTGSWRFAFEYWDDAGLRWISVFTRFAVLTDNHDDPEGNLAFAQVEGVPTADLLAFAAEKLGK